MKKADVPAFCTEGISFRSFGFAVGALLSQFYLLVHYNGNTDKAMLRTKTKKLTPLPEAEVISFVSGSGIAVGELLSRLLLYHKDTLFYNTKSLNKQ